MYEQADVPMEEAVEITVFTALHNAGAAYEDFSPEQMDVIYSVAESSGELEELLNPEFPPEQMQLIADVQNRMDAISRAVAEEALEPLIQQPMTPAEVNHARRQHNLPLDSGAETEQPVVRTMCGNPLCWHSFMQSRQSAPPNRRNPRSEKAMGWNYK